MSKSWAGGSTRAWRKVREFVLARDGYQCQVRLPGCSGRAPLTGGPGVAGHAHHTLGREVSGDDVRWIVAACVSCNLKIGDPTKRPDPAPKPRTNWAQMPIEGWDEAC